MTFEILTTLIAGLITALLGLVTSLLANRARERGRRHGEEIERLAQTISVQTEADLETQRARALEALVAKLPPATDASELLSALRAAVASTIALQPAKPPAEAPHQGPWAIVEDLVQGYHRQALDQARVQFWFSVAAATVGFALIIFMVTTAQTAQNLEFVLKVLPGAVISSVAALFFRQAGETRQRATALYDRLRSDNQKTQAMELVANIEDQTVKSVVRAQLALHMAGLVVGDLDTAALALKVRGAVTSAGKS